jgi:KDO2-lipid IV(A) lauroyltransferase
VTAGRRLRYLAEAAAVWLVFALARLLPRTRASALGGAIARTIGPALPVSRVARRNIARALPGLDAPAVAAIVRGVWDNLGRTIAEYPFLGAIDTRDARGPVAIVGMEHLESLRATGKSIVFVSAHFGNWELLPQTAGQHGLPLHLVYRQANNPYVERLIRRCRGAVRGTYHPKGAEAARGLLQAIRAGESIALLADQKMNDGIAVPFFGRAAMTAPAIADLAIRFGLAVVPVRVERAVGGRFRVIVEPPLTGYADAAALMAAINARFEDWIRAQPDHWLWLHRRWPD